MSTFAVRLKNALFCRRMTQHELADKTGLCDSAISHLTRGAREPNLPTLRAILDALPDVDARELIGCKPAQQRGEVSDG